MELVQLEITGAWIAHSPIWKDQRGHFREWFKKEEIEKTTGQILRVEQANVSLSSKGTLRGIHYSLATGGQAKWITCVSGSIRDVIVDIRPNSPTFGRWIQVELKCDSGKSVFVGEGLGHSFLSLEDNTCVVYALSTPYAPSNEFEINPLDKRLDIDWGMELSDLKISEKDRNAPTLAERLAQGNLPEIL
jgi:dTDP-4-dehydrorhamnose 3,5-epimerase